MEFANPVENDKKFAPKIIKVGNLIFAELTDSVIAVSASGTAVV